MSDEQNTERRLEAQSERQSSPEPQTQAPAPTPVAPTTNRLKPRDWIEWLEFGAGMAEVALTIFITVLIVYEVFYAKHQDELASRAPEIAFSQDSLSIGISPPDIREHPIEFVTPETGVIYNKGHVALLNGSVVAFTDQPDVKITCVEGTTPCKTHFEPAYAYRGVNFDFGTLGVHRGVQIKFSVAYQSNHKPFKVRLSVSGDNIEDSKVTDLNFDQTMTPPPSK
jgi:hypothetical protein